MTTERFITEGLASTLGGEKSTQRLFLVNLPREAVDALISTGSNIPGVPAKGENHPTTPGVYVQRHVTRDVGNGLKTEVLAEYGSSNNGVLQYAEQDITGSNFLRSVTFTTEPVAIPYAVVATATYSANGTQETLPAWKVETATVVESRVVFEARWRIPAPTLATISAFDAQNNRIHQIQGIKYLFTVGSITPLDNNFSEVSAQWVSDTGTPSGPTSSDPAYYLTVDDLPLLPGQLPFPGFARPPFSVLSTIPAPDPTQDISDVAAQPFLLVTLPYAEDLIGWQTLPSIPNL